jgi:hypothetical protein
MPTLELHRKSPLSPREHTLLPGGVELVTDEPGVIVRALPDLPLPELLQLTASLVRAVPDAKLVVKMEAGQQQYSLPAPIDAGPKDASPAVRSVIPPKRTFDDHGLAGDDPKNPWASVDAAPLDDARFEAVGARFHGHTLDSAGRERARALLQATAPLSLALGCRVARETGWRSAIQQVKRCLRHADARVRKEAVLAVGVLGGPALAVAVRPLLDDPNPEIQAAAQQALDGWA